MEWVTPQNRTGKIRFFNFLELHFIFIYNHQNAIGETEKQSKSLPGVDKSLKISGLHQIKKILILAEIEVSVRGWWHTSILRILRTLLKNFELSWGKALLWIICLTSKKVINDYCYNENDKTNGIPWFKHNLISEIRHIWGGWGWAPISTRFPVRTTKLQLQVGTKSSSIKS